MMVERVLYSVDNGRDVNSVGLYESLKPKCV